MNENAKKWVAALKGGEFRQAKQVLRDETGAYCCLGVACELFRRETGQGLWTDSFFDAGDGNKTNICLPERVKLWLGLASSIGASWTLSEELCGLVEELADDGVATVVELVTEANDRGLTFARIADLIEVGESGLFKAKG